ncbi:MAG TPA: Bcr/CflA family multidrug efflux MFS transporter [Candidatus Sulfotelmatobacter sp.]|nr:Bcr/CflA family multidrug efflux MFS transporter [Candidatus Sulfotelmatobacter sp.]
MIADRTIADRSRLFLMPALGALTAMAPMATDMYLPGLPALADDLAISPTSAQLTLSAFFFGFGGGQLLYGPLADRFGRRVPLLVGLVLFTGASLGCALAHSVDTLIVLRFLQALGGGAGPVLARASVRDLFGAGDRAARTLSTMVLIMGAAPLFAPLIGGQLLLIGGWRAIFVALSAFGAVCLVAVVLVLGETLPADQRLRVSAVGMIRSYGLLIGNRRYLGFALAAASITAGLFAYLTGSPFVFIKLYGVPAEDFGFLFAINVAGLLLGASINRRLVMRVGAHRLLSYALKVAAAAGLCLLAVALIGRGGLVALFVPLWCYISCMGFIGANAMACGLSLFPERAGTASALTGTLQFSIGALSGALVGLFNNGTALPMAAMIAIAGVSGLLIQRRLAPVAPPAPRRGI